MIENNENLLEDFNYANSEAVKIKQTVEKLRQEIQRQYRVI